MIEAVGEKYWPTYFSKIDELLAPGGKVAIQAILLEHHRMVATRDTYTWIHKYIFPGGMLPSVTAIEHTVERHTSLRLTEVAPMGQHYAHTLRLWRERFLAGWADVAALGFDTRSGGCGSSTSPTARPASAPATSTWRSCASSVPLARSERS